MMRIFSKVLEWFRVRKRESYEKWLDQKEVLPTVREKLLWCRDDYVRQERKEKGTLFFYIIGFSMTEKSVLRCLKIRNERGMNCKTCLFALKKYNCFLVEKGVQNSFPTDSEAVRQYYQKINNENDAIREAEVKENMEKLLDRIKKVEKEHSDDSVEMLLVVYLLLAKMRISEICNLKNTDLNVETGIVEYCSTKFGETIRLPLSEETRNLWDEHVKQQRRKCIYLFPNEEGTGAVEVKRMMMAVKRKIGISCHQIRRLADEFWKKC